GPASFRERVRHRARSRIHRSFSMISNDQVLTALRTVKYPGFSRDIVSFGLVKDVNTTEDRVHVLLHLSSANAEVAQAIRTEAESVLGKIPGVKQVEVDVRQPAAAAQAQPAAGAPAGGSAWSAQGRVPGVKRIIAVASGKGGVGKSTVSANLACAFRGMGYATGLLDCDIYGPSIPLMMGCRERPGISDDQRLIPPERFGVKLMSIGFLIEDDQPVIWRGPMI